VEWWDLAKEVIELDVGIRFFGMVSASSGMTVGVVVLGQCSMSIDVISQSTT
jgi:hypothetical protein